jgi:hypothetical protein
MDRSYALREYRPAKSSKLYLREWPTEGSQAAFVQPVPKERPALSLALAVRSVCKGLREGRGEMKSKWIIAGVTGAMMFLGAAKAAAQSYNPVHWLKKGPTASEQLAANTDQSKKLASELQAICTSATISKSSSTV